MQGFPLAGSPSYFCSHLLQCAPITPYVKQWQSPVSWSQEFAWPLHLHAKKTKKYSIKKKNKIIM